MALDPKLTKFTTASPIVATYSFSDVDEGTGVNIYHGFNSKAQTTKDYHLAINKLYSNEIITFATVTNGSVIEELNEDFDITFNTSKDLKGVIRINITLGGRTSGSGNTWNNYCIVEAFHVTSGGSESSIGSVRSETISETTTGQSGANLKGSKQMMLVIDASSSATHFEAGETLRFNVGCWGNSNASTGEVIGFAHDPKARTDFGPTDTIPGIIEDAHSTIFEVDVPFLLNL